MTNDNIFRLWSLGQSHLAAGRYAAARESLEQSATQALRAGDLQSLARIHLPLLEARRLMRYRAAEGRILVVCLSDSATRRRIREFSREKEGTLILGGAENNPHAAAQLARSIQLAAHAHGTALEALLVFHHPGRHQTRLASPGDATFAAGIPAHFTKDPHATVPASTDLLTASSPNRPATSPQPSAPHTNGHPHAALPIPHPHTDTPYDGKSGLGALARESLLIAWEALALRWQSRHPLQQDATPWDELHWLLEALQIDPACEPITMRLIAVAEAMQRTTHDMAASS